jgi:hypothetical protein
MMVLSNVGILVRSSPEVDPYFSVPIPDPLVRYQRAWFLLKNDVDVPLPAFMGSRLIPHPNWEYVMARADLHRLQTLREVVRGLLQTGLMGEEILWTFFSRMVQPLCQREATVRMPPGPSCPNYPISMGPGSTRINTQV